MSLFCFHLHRLLVADDREENFQCRSLLNVLHFRRREHRFEFGKRTGRDDFPLCRMAIRSASASFLQVLGRQQDGRAAAGKLLDGIPNFNSRFGVKPCRRFVEKNDGWRPDQAHGDVNPALHPAGILVCPAISRIGQAESCKQIVGNLSRIGNSPQLGDHHQVFPPGEHAVQSANCPVRLMLWRT